MPKKHLPYIALAAVCVIWGTTYLVNKLGVSHVPPFLFGFVRQSIAGLLLLGFMFFIKKHKFPSRDYILFQSIIAILLISIGNGIGTYGLQFIDSGVSAIIACISPIVIALLTIVIKPDEKLKTMGWLGILFGTIGLMIICYQNLLTGKDFKTSWLGIICTIISVTAWAFGTVWSKSRSYEVSPLIGAGIHMVVGSVPMLFLCIFCEDISAFKVDAKSLYIWSYLIILGSLVAYSSYIYALKYLPATVVSIQSYVNPIIAIILGALILKEEITWMILIGSGFTLLGIFLLNYSFLVKAKKKLITD